jgi:hypothetical protein
VILLLVGKNHQMHMILVCNTNPFDFTIKAGMYVCIYCEKLPSMSEHESLKIPYNLEVLYCLVEVSTSGTIC